MTRIVKNPGVRRNEILDTAQQLFHVKGYEQTTIRDIIGAVGIAKGTFYHHFQSKQDLLDALVERTVQDGLALLAPLVQDQQLPALEKFRRFFIDTGNFKLENRALIETLLSAMYADENAIMREKMKAASLQRVTPLLTEIIRQGVAEGTFTTSYPEAIGEIVLQVTTGFSESVARSLLAAQGSADLLALEKQVAVYEHAIALLLGAPAGSVKIIEVDGLRQWFE